LVSLFVDRLPRLVACLLGWFARAVASSRQPATTEQMTDSQQTATNTSIRPCGSLLWFATGLRDRSRWLVSLLAAGFAAFESWNFVRKGWVAGKGGPVVMVVCVCRAALFKLLLDRRGLLATSQPANQKNSQSRQTNLQRCGLLLG
jgi:hypothetical protein